MTKVVEIDGIKHEFPDDFTNDEIKGALLKHEPQQPGAQPSRDDRGAIGNLLKPITNYPETYTRMRKESGDQVSHGVDQLSHPGGAMDLVKGAANVGLGSLGFVSSPINAAIDTVAGQPIEENTGLPAKYTDFAASMALPIPKSLPRVSGGGAKTATKAPTVEQLDAAAKAGFQHPEVTTLSIKPQALLNWSDQLKAKFTEIGLDENIAPKSWAILRGLEKAPANSTVTGTNLQSLRRTFGRAAGTPDPSERLAASRAIDALDTLVGGGLSQDAVLRGDPSLVASIWSNARGDYAAARRSEKITEAMEKAGNNAGSANSGQNIDNAMRQQIKSIINNPKARRGYSGEELRQMQRIVKGTFTGDAVRYVGNLLGGGGGLGTVAAAGVGAWQGAKYGGPFGALVGVATPVVGFAFKKLGNAITGTNVEKLDDLVRARSPLAKQMIPPIQKWGEAVAAYNGSKSPQNVARLMISSRNLANNLADAGIVTSAEKLISSLQGPVDDSAGEKK